MDTVIVMTMEVVTVVRLIVALFIMMMAHPTFTVSKQPEYTILED